MTQDESAVINSNLPDALKVAIMRRLDEAASRDIEVTYMMSALNCAMLKLGTAAMIVPEADFVPPEGRLKVENATERFIKFSLPGLVGKVKYDSVTETDVAGGQG